MLITMQRAKRIAVIGAHGVGKNTLCIKLLEREKFNQRGVNVTYMPETVRSTMFMDANILEKEIGGSVDSCSWLFHRHWSQMLEHEYSCDVLISKRLPLDYVVFNQCAHKAGLADNLLDDEYMDLAVKQARSFDEVWFVRMDSSYELVNDSVRDGRSGDAEMQFLWDQVYEQVIEEEGVHVIEGTCKSLLDLHFNHPVN